MSRRERSGRDSDFRRHHSGFDRERSPKRSRRDGKPETERVHSTTDLNVEDHKDRDQKHHRRLQDTLPLEAPRAPDSKVESGVVSKDSDKKPNVHVEGNKRISDPTEVPQSRSYFQHDERGNAAQVGRSFGRRATTDHRWRDSKDDQIERPKNKSSTYDSQQRDERSLAKGNDNDVWRRDGFFKMEAEPAPPVRKRPAFREKKIQVDTENADKADSEPVRSSHSGRPISSSERRGQRERNLNFSARFERPVTGDRKEAQRGGLLSGERYGSGGGGNHWRRERLSGRQDYRPSGNRAEKWKHDLFDEANESSTTQNEEDQIAKVEALLSL